jgi:propanol-preferring alcohol dehydrogenase
VRLSVRACAVCRTDLYIVDGELPNPTLPLIPGHQVVGEVGALGDGATRFAISERVGVPWLGWTCGMCRFCRSGRENLRDHAHFTGYHRDGGYAEFAVADERYSFAIPHGYPDDQAAPLLCAGLIGYRAYGTTGDSRRLGFYGCGAAEHVLVQLARFEGREVYAFTRPGDFASQQFARELGAVWAGGTDERPDELDAAIIFAPVANWSLPRCEPSAKAAQSFAPAST